MDDTGSKPMKNSFKSASPKPSKILVATLLCVAGNAGKNCDLFYFSEAQFTAFL